MKQAWQCFSTVCHAGRLMAQARASASASAIVRASVTAAATTGSKALAVATLLLATTQPALAMFCIPLGSGGLVIGHYQPLQAAPLDAQTSFAIECFPAVPGESLNLNVRLPNAGSGRLQLSNPQADTQAAGTLAVQLYRDAGRQLPLDEQATISFRDRPLIPTRYTVSLFARVPAGQDAGTGQYRLPLTVVIDY